MCNNRDMRRSIKIYFNAPITLTFVGICIFALILNYITLGDSNAYIFSTYATNLLDPMTYVRLICHVFGHRDINHLISNAMYILLLGPILEDKYGKKLITVILVTAVVTGVVHNILDPNTMLLGASGVVFAFILLASITGKNGIPITFILVALFYLGNEIYSGIIMADNISHLTHILGGLSGALLGFSFRSNR